MTHFHFTIGPVQAFVSQARRTRDFWAGSFLLSYLTAHAMKAVQKQKGTIIMPEVSGDEILNRILTGSGSGPTIGTLPNCFEAAISGNFTGEEVAKAVQDEWKRIAAAVWKFDQLETAGVNKDLWNTQIEDFWEIAWVIADPKKTSALAMRKNWRNHYPPEQAGDKCTMMGEWQELSGAPAPNPTVQKKFWDGVRGGMGASQLELRDGERLCAISYVKRRFVHAWEDLNPDWKLPTGVPSTSYMAAVHWIKQVLERADSKKIARFQKTAKEIVDYGEWHTSIRCIEEQSGEWGAGGLFASLDGRIFFKSALENEREFDRNKAKDVLEKLKGLAETELESGYKIGDPSPFYAILVMDGDHLGKTKKAMGDDASKLSEALAAFTGEVPGIVKSHNGFLVYAGGDDVLALFPLEDVLNGALELRAAYMKVFEDKKIEAKNYSISAGVIFAHMKLPLTLVLKDAQRLLKEIAKDECGRDAIAVRIWKTGGEQLTWSMKWGLEGANVKKLSKLAKDFQKGEESEPGHASKPLFRIRERLLMLEGGADFEYDEILKLLVAEYVTSGVLGKETKKQRQKTANDRIADLLPLCKKSDGRYGAEAAMLLRFLAQKGAER